MVDDAVVLSALQAAGGNRTRAAQLAGCSRRTVQARLARPDFAEALRRAQQERAEALAERLDAAASQAVDALVEIVTSEPSPWSDVTARDRLDAARALLGRQRMAS